VAEVKELAKVSTSRRCNRRRRPFWEAIILARETSEKELTVKKKGKAPSMSLYSAHETTVRSGERRCPTKAGRHTLTSSKEGIQIPYSIIYFRPGAIRRRKKGEITNKKEVKERRESRRIGGMASILKLEEAEGPIACEKHRACWNQDVSGSD